MPYTVKAHRASDTEKPPRYEAVCDKEVISKERKLRSSDSDIHYHQSPRIKGDDFPPVFDPQETTEERTYELGSAEAGESKTKVEYRESAETTPDNTQLEGAVSGSETVTASQSRSLRLRASRLQARSDSADKAVDKTAVVSTSTSISQQPEPSAPPRVLN